MENYKDTCIKFVGKVHIPILHKNPRKKEDLNSSVKATIFVFNKPLLKSILAMVTRSSFSATLCSQRPAVKD